MGGPEDAEIENALNLLESNEVIKRTDQGYELNKDAVFSFPASQSNRKKEWFDVIKYIIGMYSEDKIYDFIFRDPEFDSCSGWQKGYIRLKWNWIPK